MNEILMGFRFLSALHTADCVVHSGEKRETGSNVFKLVQMYSQPLRIHLNSYQSFDSSLSRPRLFTFLVGCFFFNSNKNILLCLVFLKMGHRMDAKLNLRDILAEEESQF